MLRLEESKERGKNSTRARSRSKRVRHFKVFKPAAHGPQVLKRKSLIDVILIVEEEGYSLKVTRELVMTS